MNKNKYLHKAEIARQRIAEKQGIYNERDIRDILETSEVRDIIKLFEPAFDRLKTFRERLRAFLNAETELGRRLKVPLDIMTFLSPRVQSARDYVRKKILPLL